ncbi:hypothetical protein [Rhizobium sp. YTU87027]|uniref:hypothetical protein n=1 Tax=Rhizobium sp. YTU87027 TaxID=3417741 RepID=UPI003D691AA3
MSSIAGLFALSMTLVATDIYNWGKSNFTKLVREADIYFNPELTTSESANYSNTAISFMPYRDRAFCLEFVRNWARTKKFEEIMYETDEVTFSRDTLVFKVRCVESLNSSATVVIVHKIDQKNTVDEVYYPLRDEIRASMSTSGKIASVPRDDWLMATRHSWLFQFTYHGGATFEEAKSDPVFPNSIKSYFTTNGYRIAGCGNRNCSFERPGVRIWLMLREIGPTDSQAPDLYFDAMITADKVGDTIMFRSEEFTSFLSAAPSVTSVVFRIGDWS